MNDIQRLPEMIAEASRERFPDMLVTPVTFSVPLSRALGCELYFKCEHLQTTGSFKFRGAANKFRLLKQRGAAGEVVAASTGNHGQAVALAARRAGYRATIFVPAAASPAKLAAIEGYGATIERLEGQALDSEQEARRVAKERGQEFISPYNDIEVVAGQGTVGLELLEQVDGIDAVFASVGGGGLIGGLGAAIKAQLPEIEIVGCWPENSPAMHDALERGRIIDVPELETLSDGTAGGIEEGSITFPICREVIDRRVLVSEAAIASAIRDVAAHERWMIEGAAGVALAGLAALQDQYRGKRVVVILCGRNIALDKFIKAVA